MNRKSSQKQNIPQNWVNQKGRNSQRDSIENKNNLRSRASQIDNIKIKNEGFNSIEQSGNSDVDVHVDVHVDTTPIAFAILCSLLATKQMNNFEFEEAVDRLQSLTPKEDFIYSLNPPNNTNLLENKRDRKRVD